MNVTFTKKQDAVHGRVIGVINFESSEDFQAAIQRQIDRGEKDFVLDFSRVPYINSTGLGKILVIYKQLKQKNGSLKITGLLEEVYNMMTLIKMNKILPLEKKQD